MKIPLLISTLLCTFPLHASFDGYTAATYIPQSKKATYGIVNAKQIKTWLENKKPVLILDARSETYDDGKRLPGAQLLPHNSKDRLIYQTIPSYQAVLVVYCSNLRCPASQYLAHRLVDLGYRHVYKYPEGISDWIKRGYRIERASK